MRSSLSFALVAACLCLMAGGAFGSCNPCHEGSNGCYHCYNNCQCKTCVKGYYKKNWKCYKCPAWCSSCKRQNGQVFCTSCQHGYSLHNGKCQQDSSCPSPSFDYTHHKWTNVYAKWGSSCKQCDPQGSFYEYCSKCDYNDPTYCKKCWDPSDNHHALYVDSHGECAECDPGCLACTNGNGWCTECDNSNGYWSDGSGGCVLQTS